MIRMEIRNKGNMSNPLLGQAVGDALGVPFESMLAINKAITEWDGKSYGSSEYHQLKSGQYSDDTQMAMMVAESLIDRSGFDPEDLSARYVDWIESGVARGYGRTTLLAVNNLKSGKSWEESGVPGSYGNGTAMRAAPFGVYYRDDLYSLEKIVKMDSAITHKSDEAEAGALAIALAAYYIANENTDDMIQNICRALPSSVVKTKLSQVPKVVASKAEPLAALKVIGTRADVRQTVPAVFYCYLKFPKFEDAIEHAIRAGGDTDTTAAIVGALIGIRDGIRGIPQAWVDGVEDKDKLILLDSKLTSRSKVDLFSRGDANV